MALFDEIGNIQSNMKVLGILPIKKQFFLQNFLYVFNSINILNLLIYLCRESLNLPNFWHGVTSFTITGSIFSAFIRISLTRYQIVHIQKLFHDLDSISFKNCSPEGAKIYAETVQRAKLISKLIFICYTAIITAVIMEPLMFWQFVLPVDFWFPAEYSRDFNSWIGPYIIQVMNSICVLFTTILVDAIPTAIMLIIAGQLKNLGNHLKSLPIYPVGRWTHGLKFCFKEYMKIRRICNDFGKLFSTIYLFQMAMLCFNLCASTVAVTKMSGTTKAMGIGASMTLVFQLFCPCFLGNLIFTNGERLQTQLYSSKWYELNSTESKKELLIFMEVLKKPVFISFGQIFVLNLQTFTGVVNIAYKLFALVGFLIEEK